MKTAITAVASAVILMGLLHIFIVLPIRDFNLGYLWYLGSGLAIIFVGVINLIGKEGKRTPLSVGLVLLSTVLICLVYVGILFMVPEFQVYVGIALFAALAILTILDYRKEK